MAPQLKKLPMRPLGSQGMMTGAQGLGCMGMSFGYVTDSASDQECLTVVSRAKHLGVTMLDTADMYGPHRNEILLSNMIGDPSKRAGFQIATKFGNRLTPEGQHTIDGSPGYVKHAFEGSWERLGSPNFIDLYYQHRVDPDTPIEKTVQAMAELVKSGKVKYLGLSECTPSELRRAHVVHPITAVQMEWSLFSRDVEAELVPTCRELGVGIVAYSPLSRGILSGRIESRDDLAANDSRLTRFPRFHPDNFEKNLAIAAKVEDIAKSHDATSAQVAMAWLHAQGDDVFPIPGTKRVKYLDENVAAFSLKLSPQSLQSIEEAFPPGVAAGGRYRSSMDQYSYHTRNDVDTSAAIPKQA